MTCNKQQITEAPIPASGRHTPRIPFITTGASRRAFVKGVAGFLGGSACLSLAHPAFADGLPPLPVASMTSEKDAKITTLIVGGGVDSLPSRWASLLAAPLGLGSGADRPLQLQQTTGRDGVTAANIFDTQNGGDNDRSLIVPGATLLASMIGDPRVHFDPTRWIPIFMAISSPIVVGHADFHRSLRTLLKPRQVRVAVSTPDGPELPTLLAMQLLSMAPVPVPSYASPESALDALKKGLVDIVQLPAETIGQQPVSTLLEGTGADVLFRLPPANFSTSSDQNTIPDFTRWFRMQRNHLPSGAMADAFNATAAAISTDALLAMPILSSADQTARWRHAASAALNDPAVRAEGIQMSAMLAAGTSCVPLFAQLTPDATALLALRRWLARQMPLWQGNKPPGKP